MNPEEYADESYTQPHVPPATAPVIDGQADACDAATLANDNGDSDYSYSRLSDVDRGGEDDDVAPGDTPDEIVPDDGDIVEPVIPDEITPDEGDIVVPDGGDIIEPGSVPHETPMPPD